MVEDNEGFKYPFIDQSICVDCGICEKVCPVLCQFEPNTPATCIAAINPDEGIRSRSSSGGVFSLLAEYILNQNGVVYGAAFSNEWIVKHIRIENKKELWKIRGSKYVQSKMDGIYSMTKKDLDKGIKVLFSGTQCQIAGLNHFLRQWYDNLITVEVICHGVPSPAVWKDYLGNSNYHEINFRDKRNGWSPSGISKDDKFVIHDDDKYMQSFFSHINMRPSCYSCPAKNGKSGADITIGDFWGIKDIDPEMYDNKGTSIIAVHSSNGHKLIDSIIVKKRIIDYQIGIRRNPSISTPVDMPINRTFFFYQFNQNGFEKAWNMTSSKNPLTRAKRILFRKLHHSQK